LEKCQIHGINKSQQNFSHKADITEPVLHSEVIGSSIIVSTEATGTNVSS